MRDRHHQIVISIDFFTEKLSVGDGSIAAFEQRAHEDGDHFLTFDSEAGTAKLNGPGKYMLGFKKIGAQAKNLRDI
jgi:hypothetical protein